MISWKYARQRKINGIKPKLNELCANKKEKKKTNPFDAPIR